MNSAALQDARGHQAPLQARLPKRAGSLAVGVAGAVVPAVMTAKIEVGLDGYLLSEVPFRRNLEGILTDKTAAIAVRSS